MSLPPLGGKNAATCLVNRLPSARMTHSALQRVLEIVSGSVSYSVWEIPLHIAHIPERPIGVLDSCQIGIFFQAVQQRRRDGTSLMRG